MTQDPYAREYEGTPDHVEQGVDHLYVMLKQEKTIDFVSAFLEEVQRLEEVWSELIIDRFFENAVGEVLTFWGKLLGVDRDGVSDTEYRGLISARMIANISNAILDQCIRCFNAVAEDPPHRASTEKLYPAGIHFWAIRTQYLSRIARQKLREIMLDCIGAGVALELTETLPGAKRFDQENQGFDKVNFAAREIR